jgi:hypothetical protein
MPLSQLICGDVRLPHDIEALLLLIRLNASKRSDTE